MVFYKLFNEVQISFSASCAYHDIIAASWLLMFGVFWIHKVMPTAADNFPSCSTVTIPRISKYIEQTIICFKRGAPSTWKTTRTTEGDAPSAAINRSGASSATGVSVVWMVPRVFPSLFSHLAACKTKSWKSCLVQNDAKLWLSEVFPISSATSFLKSLIARKLSLSEQTLERFYGTCDKRVQSDLRLEWVKAKILCGVVPNMAAVK